MFLAACIFIRCFLCVCFGVLFSKHRFKGRPGRQEAPRSISFAKTNRAKSVGGRTRNFFFRFLLAVCLMFFNSLPVSEGVVTPLASLAPELSASRQRTALGQNTFCRFAASGGGRAQLLWCLILSTERELPTCKQLEKNSVVRDGCFD